MSKPVPGIMIRHARSCRVSRDRDAGCNCTPTYQAHVWSAREGKRVRRTCPTLSAAKTWRQDAVPSTTVRRAWEAWKAGAEEGTIRTRSGDTYKPSALRGYEQAMRIRLLDELGALRLSDVARLQLQDLADRLLAEGVDPSTIRNTFLPLRAIYRRAVARGEVAVNPTSGLELPAVRGRRERIASPAEAPR